MVFADRVSVTRIKVIEQDIDENEYLCYFLVMKNTILSSAVLVASFSFGGIALACDLHGAGYGGYGLRNAPWQPYNPQVSTTDPAFDENGLITLVPTDVAPPAKAKPSFSNAANNAASKAKVRVLKKVEADKTVKQVTVKKAALNADR